MRNDEEAEGFVKMALWGAHILWCDWKDNDPEWLKEGAVGPYRGPELGTIYGP